MTEAQTPERVDATDLDYLSRTQQELQRGQQQLAQAQQQVLLLQGAALGAAQYVREKHHIAQGDTFDQRSGIITRGPAKSTETHPGRTGQAHHDPAAQSKSNGAGAAEAIGEVAVAGPVG